MDNNNETVISTTDTASNEAEIVIDESLDSEAKVKALEEQNKKLFERAKKAEGFIRNEEGHWIKKPKTEIKPDKTDSSFTNQNSKPSDILKADEFKLYRKGYDEDEIDIIMHNGGMKILEDKNNPITLGLEARKQQRKAESAASQTSDISSLGEVERKYTPEMLKNMSSKDLEKILPHA